MIDRLRELLRAATPGPWTWTETGGAMALVLGPDGDELARVRMNLGFGSNPDRDAAYIAACNPDTIAELLDAHDRMAGALRAIVDLPTVVPDHGHGGVNPPYLEWKRVALTVRAALAVPKEENPE